jgi:phage baseplate assembly protein W
MALYVGYSTVNRNQASVRLTDTDLIKQDLINHFHISKGEKLHNPDFGTIIWQSLFEPFTADLKNAIVEDVYSIAANDPRLQIVSVLVDSYENGILLALVVKYTNSNHSETLKLKFDKTKR